MRKCARIHENPGIDKLISSIERTEGAAAYSGINGNRPIGPEEKKAALPIIVKARPLIGTCRCGAWLTLGGMKSSSYLSGWQPVYNLKITVFRHLRPINFNEACTRSIYYEASQSI